MVSQQSINIEMPVVENENTVETHETMSSVEGRSIPSNTGAIMRVDENVLNSNDVDSEGGDST
jgi:hypothetical protein